jgi:hypothetical protein
MNSDTTRRLQILVDRLYEPTDSQVGWVEAIINQFSVQHREVESRASIISRPSLLDLDVPLSVHPAPDILGLCLAHVHIVMAALVNSH